METPNKMIGGIAGAMAQQTGAIDQTTGLPMQQPVFPPTAQQAGQAMFGTQQPGSYDRVMPQAGVSAPLQQHHDKKEKVLVTGNTKSEQIVANNIEAKKQVKFAKEFNDYTAAIKNKKNWENKENDFGFGGKKYPQQKQLDSLRTVYKNLK